MAGLPRLQKRKLINAVRTMAFGITRHELNEWKRKVKWGEVAFLTHYWLHPRFPDVNTVTKVGCSDLERLIHWGLSYDLKEEWIDARADYPHFDLIGQRQREILHQEGIWDQIRRFRLFL